MIRRLKERCRSDTATDEEGNPPTTAAAAAETAVQPAMEKKRAVSRHMTSNDGMKIGAMKDDDRAASDDSKVAGRGGREGN